MFTVMNFIESKAGPVLVLCGIRHNPNKSSENRTGPHTVSEPDNIFVICGAIENDNNQIFIDITERPINCPRNL